MGNAGWLEQYRDWIGRMGWMLFLWGRRTTKQKFWRELYLFRAEIRCEWTVADYRFPDGILRRACDGRETVRPRTLDQPAMLNATYEEANICMGCGKRISFPMMPSKPHNYLLEARRGDNNYQRW